jgi:hypothetical protein
LLWQAPGGRCEWLTGTELWVRKPVWPQGWDEIAADAIRRLSALRKLNQINEAGSEYRSSQRSIFLVTSRAFAVE